MKIFGASWKTSASGLGAVAAGLVYIGAQQDMFPVSWKPYVSIVGVLGGALSVMSLGFNARDNRVTSKQVVKNGDGDVGKVGNSKAGKGTDA